MLREIVQVISSVPALTAGPLLRAGARLRCPVENSDTLRVAVLAEGELLSPASRYRVLQYLPLLRELEIESDFRPSRPGKYFFIRPFFESIRRRSPFLAKWAAAPAFLRQYGGRWLDYRRCSRADVVWLQRDLIALERSRLELFLPLFNRRLVFDFDDAIYRSPPWTPPEVAAARDAELSEKIAMICQIATVVVVSTEELATFARRHCRRIEVIPTTLCTDRFRPPPMLTTRRRPVIGWVGTSGNLHYLRAIAGALRDLATRRDFVLRVVCDPVGEDAFGDLPRDRLEVIPWTEEHEVERIQQFDIGIMPIGDDGWSRAKAGFKLLQYMACGVPIVYSPYGANLEVAGDGTGIPATDPASWTDALERLLASPELRQKLGQAGRARAVDRFDRRRWVPQIARILREVAAGG